MRKKLKSESAIFEELARDQYRSMFKSMYTEAEGTYGKVLKATGQDDKVYAIKEFKDIDQNLDQIILEAQVMKSFHHLNILELKKAYFICNKNDPELIEKIIFQSQYCTNGDLFRYQRNLNMLTLLDKIKLCLQISNAVQHIHHQKYMHRDIKPQNILLDSQMNVKICDFGFCKNQQEGSIKNTPNLGTPLYSDPALQTGKYTKKCDIFSLGCLIYFIITQKHLFVDGGSQIKSRLRQSLADKQRSFLKNKDQEIQKMSISEDLKRILKLSITQNEEERVDAKEFVFLIQQFYKKNGGILPSLKEQKSILQLLQLQKKESKSSNGSNQKIKIKFEAGDVVSNLKLGVNPFLAKNQSTKKQEDKNIKGQEFHVNKNIQSSSVIIYPTLPSLIIHEKQQFIIPSKNINYLQRSEINIFDQSIMQIDKSQANLSEISHYNEENDNNFQHFQNLSSSDDHGYKLQKSKESHQEVQEKHEKSKINSSIQFSQSIVDLGQSKPYLESQKVEQMWKINFEKQKVKEVQNQIQKVSMMIRYNFELKNKDEILKQQRFFCERLQKKRALVYEIYKGIQKLEQLTIEKKEVLAFYIFWMYFHNMMHHNQKLTNKLRQKQFLLAMNDTTLNLHEKLIAIDYDMLSYESEVFKQQILLYLKNEIQKANDIIEMLGRSLFIKKKQIDRNVLTQSFKKLINICHTRRAIYCYDEIHINQVIKDFKGVQNSRTFKLSNRVHCQNATALLRSFVDQFFQ